MQLTATKSPGRLAGRVSLGAALPKFLKDQCVWPDSIGADEEFTGKLVIRNDGDAGQVWLGLTYRGESYLIMIDGQESILLEAGQGMEATYKGTMREFLGELEDFDRTKTINMTFLTGRLVDGQHEITDSWEVSTTVKVGIGIPMWALVTGGVALAGVGIILVTRR